MENSFMFVSLWCKNDKVMKEQIEFLISRLQNGADAANNLAEMLANTNGNDSNFYRGKKEALDSVAVELQDILEQCS